MPIRPAVAILVGLTALAAHGLLHAEEAPSPAPPSVLIEGVPHVRQKPDFCGEACVESWLRKLGRDVDQDAVFDVSGLDPAKGRGCFTRELAQAVRRLGFRPGDVWHQVAAETVAVAGVWEALRQDLADGIPSIVCMRYDERPDTTEHFRLVLGHDTAKDEVIYHEPAEAGGGYRRMSRDRFLSLWPLKYATDRWTVIRLRLEAGELRDPPAPAASARFTDADFAQHVRALKSRLPRGDFTIVIEKPFVVVGDERPTMVRRRAAQTVRWAAERLRKAFFAEDPLHILDVWLFKNAASYQKNAMAMFGTTRGTPYGFYSPRHHALVMNIATGGGTLVHEIVHPYVEANFPACPPWLNEGLGSLYEQCEDRGGEIMGRTNWRLRGLHGAVREGRLPSFEKLCGMSAAAFYGDARGDHYAQARYLLYHLQEKGLLRKYYAAFHAARKEDPTGYATLKAVLEEEDMKAFQERWEAWALTLVFR